MLTDDELDGMRAASLSALPDTVTIVRPAAPGAGTLNTSTGVLTPAASTTIYTGDARLRPAGTEEQAMVFGDVQVTELRYVLTLPHDVADILVDDVVTVAATDTNDPRISTRSFRVTRAPSGSWLIDRRVGVERVSVT